MDLLYRVTGLDLLFIKAVWKRIYIEVMFPNGKVYRIANHKITINRSKFPSVHTDDLSKVLGAFSANGSFNFRASESRYFGARVYSGITTTVHCAHSDLQGSLQKMVGGSIRYPK